MRLLKRPGMISYSVPMPVETSNQPGSLLMIPLMTAYPVVSIHPASMMILTALRLTAKKMSPAAKKMSSTTKRSIKRQNRKMKAMREK